MRFARHARVFRGQLDPLLPAGVVMLLLLFVLLQSNLVFPPGLPILLPEAEGFAGVTNTMVTVAVDAKGQCFFQNQLAREEDLQEGFMRIVERTPGPVTLVLMADGSVPIEKLVRLRQVAGTAGIHDVLLATRPPAARGVARP